MAKSFTIARESKTPRLNMARVGADTMALSMSRIIIDNVFHSRSFTVVEAAEEIAKSLRLPKTRDTFFALRGVIRKMARTGDARRVASHTYRLTNPRRRVNRLGSKYVPVKEVYAS